MSILKSNLQNYVNTLYNNFSNIVREIKKSRENPYEISSWVKKETKEKDILIYRVTATDKYVSSFSVLDIYSDDSILLNFSKEEIKYISTLAILIHYKYEPKYKVMWESFRNELQNHILCLNNRDKRGIIKLKIHELESHFELLDNMSSQDAYRLGKTLGIRERILEEKMINTAN